MSSVVRSIIIACLRGRRVCKVRLAVRLAALACRAERARAPTTPSLLRCAAGERLRRCGVRRVRTAIAAPGQSWADGVVAFWRKGLRHAGRIGGGP
jgi:hypothetical protein